LDALAVAITRRKVNHILDADIRDFFGSVNHDWLIRFLEHRIGDKRIIRLIRKWLKAGMGMLLSWVKVANPSSQDRTPRCAILSALLPAGVPYRASGLVVCRACSIARK
jgi:retron-type reverse transcriptase